MGLPTLHQGEHGQGVDPNVSAVSPGRLPLKSDQTSQNDVLICLILSF
jgi:hypothetical protein